MAKMYYIHVLIRCFFLFFIKRTDAYINLWKNFSFLYSQTLVLKSQLFRVRVSRSEYLFKFYLKPPGK